MPLSPRGGKLRVVTDGYTINGLWQLQAAFSRITRLSLTAVSHKTIRNHSILRRKLDNVVTYAYKEDTIRNAFP